MNNLLTRSLMLFLLSASFYSYSADEHQTQECAPVITRTAIPAALQGAIIPVPTEALALREQVIKRLTEAKNRTSQKYKVLFYFLNQYDLTDSLEAPNYSAARQWVIEHINTALPTGQSFQVGYFHIDSLSQQSVKEMLPPEEQPIFDQLAVSAKKARAILRPERRVLGNKRTAKNADGAEHQTAERAPVITRTAVLAIRHPAIIPVPTEALALRETVIQHVTKRTPRSSNAYKILFYFLNEYDLHSELKPTDYPAVRQWIVNYINTALPEGGTFQPCELKILKFKKALLPSAEEQAIFDQLAASAKKARAILRPERRVLGNKRTAKNADIGKNTPAAKKKQTAQPETQDTLPIVFPQPTEQPTASAPQPAPLVVMNPAQQAEAAAARVAYFYHMAAAAEAEAKYFQLIAEGQGNSATPAASPTNTINPASSTEPQS